MNKKNCTAMEDKLADMLLAPESVPAKVKAHVAECEACTRELAELRATMTLLDAWQAPEPSPFFMTRMHVRLNDARQAEPAGWLERLRARFVYGNHLHARPLAATALTVILLLGGGTYLGLMGDWEHSTAAPPQAAVVHDLQVLDNNAQLLDQLESISNNDNTEN